MNSSMSADLSLQGAVGDTGASDVGQIQHRGDYDWIHTHPGHSDSKTAADS